MEKGGSLEIFKIALDFGDSCKNTRFDRTAPNKYFITSG